MTAPLFPNEPRIANPAKEQALTERYLLPALDALETLMLELRAGQDLVLQPLQPTKLGKPYPLGQCLEITLAMHRKLGDVDVSSLSPMAAKGLLAIRAFRRNGGSLRQVWGDLRGQYFQNAFLLGTLYVDVSNDTVVPTKPKVEILPFADVQFIPIADYRHYARIATAYWQGNIYPNHALPELAPHCPLVHVSSTGKISVLDNSQYMLAMNRANRFQSSEAVLRDAPMPREVFEHIVDALRGERLNLAQTLEQGRKLTLQLTREYRAKRWYQSPQQTTTLIQAIQNVNTRLVKWHHRANRIHGAQPIIQNDMTTIKIDNRDYDLDTLSADAKAQLQSLQFVEVELQRMQAQTAVLQTARAAYFKALQAALPSALEQAQASETLKFN